MEPVQDERLLYAVAVRDGERPRPEFVVLRLAERRVVPKSVFLEAFSVEDDRVVEDGRAEQCPPAKRGGTSLEHVEVARASVPLDVEHARADEAELRVRLEQREAEVEPVREGDVVGVHAGDVATSRLLEPAVQRPRQAESAPRCAARAAAGRRCRRGSQACRRSSGRRRRAARGPRRSDGGCCRARGGGSARRRGRRRAR